MWGPRADHFGQPLVIAHRGASAAALENTVEAFARARADGADGVELDVLACASGQIVVFHDDDLTRLGGRPERVAESVAEFVNRKVDVVVTNATSVLALKQATTVIPIVFVLAGRSETA